MSLPEGLREQVRQRAGFACEFCEVTEADAGGLLTIDHFQPSTQGGSDALENLVYCCPRCNQYKADYWPTALAEPALWDPRHSQASTHFLQLEDGTFHALSAVGAFTLRRLRLNRPPLVVLRLRKRLQGEESRLLAQYRDLVAVLERLSRQQARLLEDQRRLLEAQRDLLSRLLAGE